MTAIRACAIENCRAGIGLEGRLEIKWRISVSAGDIVERGCQAGYKEATLQWLMGLFVVKCVFNGQIIAVRGVL